MPPPLPPPTLPSYLEGLSQDDFDSAVSELSKAKLERPKRLGELAQRAWSEVQQGSHLWGRPEAEVEQLRSISRQELLEFARQVGAVKQCVSEMHLQGTSLPCDAAS